MIIFRPHNIYGPDMGEEHVVSEILSKILKKKQKIIKFLGSGNETRSFMYIDNFNDALYKVMTKGRHLNIYNIGSGKETKIRSLLSIIAKKIKEKLKVSIKFYPSHKNLEGSPKRRCPDIKKLKKLKFKTKINLQEGIKKTIDLSMGN